MGEEIQFIFAEMKYVEMDPTEFMGRLLDLEANAWLVPVVDVWETQDHYLELWTDKIQMLPWFHALLPQIRIRAAGERSAIGPWLTKSRKRFAEKAEQGKKGVLLYTGDLDPDRWAKYERVAAFFEGFVEVVRVAFNEGQITDLRMQSNPTRRSKTGRALDDAFMKRFPRFEDRCYELEAIPPAELVSLVKKVVFGYFDHTKVDMEVIERWEAKCAEARAALVRALKGSGEKAPVEGFLGISRRPGVGR